ncbi:MAG: hypothetical protein HQK84_10115, partial [Nitrospinae bacterium]|nr:hypothetical protein [Nitrospinota bacterium]
MKIGQFELSKNEVIAIVVGLLLILGGGGYWFYLNYYLAEDTQSEDTLGDLEGNEDSEELSFDDLVDGEEGDDELYDEELYDEESDDTDMADSEGGEEELFGDEETVDEESGNENKEEDDLFADEKSDETVKDNISEELKEETSVETKDDTAMEVAQKEEKVIDKEFIEKSKEKGNILELEKNPEKQVRVDQKELKGESVKEILKSEEDDVSNKIKEEKREVREEKAKDVPIIQDKKKVLPPVRKIKAKMRSYTVKGNESFVNVMRSLGYPHTLQSKLEFLANNPNAFSGMFENGYRELILPMHKGLTLKLPRFPFKGNGMYRWEKGKVISYVIEFYESYDEDSAVE